MKYNQPRFNGTSDNRKIRLIEYTDLLYNFAQYMDYSSGMDYTVKPAQSIA